MKKRYSLSDSIMHLIEDHGEMVKYLRNKSERYKSALYKIYYMQTDRQTDSLYFSMVIIKAMQLVGSCINTKPKSEIYA